MALLRPKFEVVNRYDGLTLIERSGVTYGFYTNQDEDDFKVFDPSRGALAIDPRTGKSITPKLDVEYPMLTASFNTFYGYKCYANVMLTRDIDDELREKRGVLSRDHYDVSVLLRLQDAEQVVSSIAGRTMVGEPMERKPLQEGHSAEIVTPSFR